MPSSHATMATITLKNLTEGGALLAAFWGFFFSSDFLETTYFLKNLVIYTYTFFLNFNTALKIFLQLQTYTKV